MDNPVDRSIIKKSVALLNGCERIARTIRHAATTKIDQGHDPAELKAASTRIRASRQRLAGLQET